MYKAVFQNSKAALVFAGMTIVSAVVMVGSPDDQGTLSKTMDRYSQQRETFADDARDFAKEQSVPDAAPKSAIDPNAGWGSSKSAVFGDYAAQDTTNGVGGSVGVGGGGSGGSGAPVIRAQNRPSGAVIPGPQPVVSDTVSLPAPGDGNNTIPPVPVITARQMTLEPN